MTTGHIFCYNKSFPKEKSVMNVSYTSKITPSINQFLNCGQCQQNAQWIWLKPLTDNGDGGLNIQVKLFVCTLSLFSLPQLSEATKAKSHNKMCRAMAQVLTFIYCSCEPTVANITILQI